VTTPLVFTARQAGQTVTVTLTALGDADLEFRVWLDGVACPNDTMVEAFESTAVRDRVLAERAASYESRGYARVA
jgi:hypothetical protein